MNPAPPAQLLATRCSCPLLFPQLNPICSLCHLHNWRTREWFEPWASPSQAIAHHQALPRIPSILTAEELYTWRDQLHLLPIKDDFKLLISEVKEARRSEIKTLQVDFYQLATQVEDLEEDLQSTKLTTVFNPNRQMRALCSVTCNTTWKILTIATATTISRVGAFQGPVDRRICELSSRLFSTTYWVSLPPHILKWTGPIELLSLKTKRPNLEM